MSAVSRTSVLVVGSLAGTLLVWIPGVAPAQAEPVKPTYDSASYSVGPNPNSVAVGDLDGDGDLDLVTADLGANAIKVLTRGSGGSYTSTATVSTQVGNGGFAPTSVAIADLDADGDQDVVTANLSGDVTVLTRGSDGTYDAGTPVVVGSAPYSVAIGDLDGDGDQDLVTANRDDNTVSLLTRGSGGAYARTDAGVGVSASGPLSVKIGDLDGDGDQDLATANADSDSLTVLTRGPGGAYDPTVTSTGEYPTSVVIGDLDGDGDQDLVTANARSDSLTVLNRGAGGAYASRDVPSGGSYTYSVAIGDVDGDGDQDLVAANGGSDDVAVLTRGAGGAYVSAVAGDTGTGPVSVAIGDLDRDGDLDLVTANAGSDDVTVLTNTAAHRPPNYYASTTAGTTGDRPVAMAVGDLDGDGDQDIATANNDSNNVTVLTRGPGGGYTSSVAGSTGNGPYAMAIGDMDGDGDQDIAAVNNESSDVSLLRRGPGGGYTSSIIASTGAALVSVALGDLDGDGDQDLVTVGDSSVITLTRGPGGAYTPAFIGDAVGAASVAISDLDGDGDQDVVAAGEDAVVVFSRGPGGAYTGQPLSGVDGGSSVVVGDLDGDGDQDLALAQERQDRVIVLSRDSGGYTSAVAGPAGSTPRSLAVGDLDGDGDQDIVAGGGSSVVSVLTRAADGTYAPSVAGAAGSLLSSVAVGDLDGDGDQDIAVANAESDDVTVLTAGRDEAAPTTTDDVPTTPRNAAAPVTLTATDTGGSGTKEIRYAVGANPGTPTTLYDPASKPTLSDGQSIRYFAVDNAGNAEAAHTSAAVQIDTTRPSVTLSAPAGLVNGAFTVTATFSEAVTGLAADDFVIGNGTAGALTGSGGTYTVAVTPSADGAVTVDLPAAAASDAATNTSTAATQLVRTADLVRPTVVLSTPSGTVNGAFTVTATFSEAVTGLAADDFVIGNGTAGALTGSGNTYTVKVTPSADGAVTVDLPAGSARDGAENTSTAATQLVRTADLTRPTVALSAATGTVNGAFTVTATFSESVTGLTADDFVIGNGTAGALTGSGDTYTVAVTPSADGAVTVDLPAGSARDGADNTSTAATRLSRTADLTRPGVTLSAPAGPFDGPFTLTATFSESVSGLSAADFVVDNGTVGDLKGSGDTYTLAVTPAAIGQISVDLPAGSVEDAVGNTSTAAARLTRTVVKPTFTTGPDATITGAPVVGGTLTAASGTTTPTAESFTYVWAADGTTIAGATASTLTLDAAQLGRTITVSVTATRSGYDDATDTSAPTKRVAEGTFAQGPTASVTGTARVGQTLTASTGSPVPSPDSYGYAWYAGDVAIAGATGPQLVLTAEHAGRPISVEVTARRAGYTDAVSARSAATALVVADRAPGLTLRVSVPRSSGRAVDGTATVQRRTKVTIAWAAGDGATVRATGALGKALAKRYPDGRLPRSGRVTVRLKRLGVHPFRMTAAGTGGTTSAYAAVTVVRPPKRLRVETPAVARSGHTTSLRVAGLGRREVYRITLTLPGSRTPLVRTFKGRADTSGVIRRRLVVPDLAAGEKRIVVRVTGGPRRTGTIVVRVR